MIKLLLQISLVSAASVFECSICRQAESHEGKLCERVCDFCRTPNVHMSCLVEFYQREQKASPELLTLLCPSCPNAFGPQLRVKLYTLALKNLEKNDQDKREIVMTLIQLG